MPYRGCLLPSLLLSAALGAPGVAGAQTRTAPAGASVHVTFENGEISVRFQMVGGALDRCAGILFNVKPNGDYLTVRFNGTEDNVVLWTFNAGVRKFVKRGAENVPLELGRWHTLRIAVHGTQLQGFLDDKLLLEHTLSEPVSGKVGVWSKTDSMVEFDDFTVTPAAK